MNLAKVRVSTKYALSNEALALCGKGKTWWCRNRLKGEFVKIPYTAANQPFDFEIEVEDGEYQISCGDYNAMDSNGRHCTQNVYFYVQDGKLHYVKRKDEFPSAGGSTPSGSSSEQPAFNPFGQTAQTPAPSAPASAPTIKYKAVEGLLYCEKNGKVVTPDYTCVVDFVSDNDAVSGLDCCECCRNKKVIYLKEE